MARVSVCQTIFLLLNSPYHQRFPPFIWCQIIRSSARATADKFFNLFGYYLHTPIYIDEQKRIQLLLSIQLKKSLYNRFLLDFTFV